MAERRFSVRLDAEMNIGQVKTAVQQMQVELSKLSLPSDMGSKISSTFSKLTGEIEKFQAMSAKGIGSTQDFNQLATSGNKIIQIYEQLTNQVKSLGNLSDNQLSKLFPASILNNIQKATNAVQQYENATKGTQGQMTDLAKEIEKAKNKTSQLVKQKESLEKKTAVSDTTFAQLGKDAEEAKRKFEEAQAKLIELQNQAKQKVDAAGSSSLARKSSTYRNLVDSDIPAQEAEVAKLEQAWNRVENKKNKALSQSAKDQSIAQLISDIKKAEGNVTELQNKLNTLKINDSQSFQNLVAQLNQISGINLDPATATMYEIQQAIANLSSSELENLKNSFSNFSKVVENGRGSIQTFNNNIDETRGKVKQLDQTMSEVDSLKSRVNYFFGLTNSVYLLKRALTSAMNTVKELDAVMTETAVVTDFTVGDMWEKLPEYSAEATKLGASIKDLYAATTLYYQQGLQTEAAMGVGIETMKMARIAGMEAAEATEAMTAALRGFNMEVNETNAVRVNDVYSELAAITAADTEQIATAMSKTASIASSANMEFETTAALLAQIIETTQEAPETAGTAMKTIIARFTEVKQLFTEGMLTGEDEEGEEININKIDAALKTVGISLKDFLNGSKGIDDIFLELASKWDSLDLATQRYIATMAAGSRQQSRFIAMMSNYERTIELVSAANNSAGASQQQFEKTLESMEAKLQNLKNAWDQFAMGIADNEILKGAVDLLTGILTTVNKLIDGISGGNGLLKSVLTLTTAFATLKLGGKALKGGLELFTKSKGPGILDYLIGSKDSKGNYVRDDELHNQKLKNVLEEHRARIEAIKAEEAAAIKAKADEARAAVKGEEAEKYAALESETAEKHLALEGESAEKYAALESETIEKMAALEGETAEKIAAIEGEYAEQMAALNKKYSFPNQGKDALKNKFFGGTNAASIAAGALGGGIGGAIGGSIIAEAFDKATETSAEALDGLTGEIEGLEASINTTRSALDNFKTVKSTLKDYNKQLKAVEKNSIEYYKTLSESNSTARELINNVIGQKALKLGQGQELYHYEEGQLIIDDKFYELYEQVGLQQLQTQENELLRLYSEQNMTKTSKNLDDSGIKTSNVTEEEEKQVRGWTIGTGAAAGIGAGILTTALAGISAGSLAGPIGAAVGLIAGLVVGSITTAVGNSVAQQGNSETDYQKLYKQLGTKGAEITQSDIEALQANDYDLEKVELDSNLESALSALKENLGPDAFVSLIDSLNGNTDAVNQNTQKYLSENQEGFNSRQQEFYNRLLANNPNGNTDTLWNQAGILSTQWTEDDIQNEIDKVYSEQSDFGSRTGKENQSQWRTQINERAKAAGITAGEYGLTHFENGKEMVWNFANQAYEELEDPAYYEDMVKRKEAENTVMQEIVTGKRVASGQQVKDNVETEIEEDYKYQSQKQNWEQHQIEAKTLSDRYKDFQGTKEYENFGMYKSYDNALSKFMTTTGTDQISALNEIFEFSNTDPMIKDAMAAMNIDLYQLQNDLIESGAYSFETGFNYDKIGSGEGQILIEDLLNQQEVYTPDYVNKQLALIENEERNKNTELWDGLANTDLDFSSLWNEIFSFESEVLQNKFTNIFKDMDLSQLTEEQKKQLENSMSTLDLTDKKGLEEFYRLLVDLGLVDASGLESFVNDVSNLTGAISEVGKITANSAAQLASALDKLRNNEGLTADEYAALINQSPEIAGSFIKVGDEYYLSSGISGSTVAAGVEAGMELAFTEQGQQVERGRLFEKTIDDSTPGGLEEAQIRAAQLFSGQETGYNQFADTAFMRIVLQKAYGMDTTDMDYNTLLNNFKTRYEQDYGLNGTEYQNNKIEYQGAIINSGSLKGATETQASDQVVDATLTQLAGTLDMDPTSLIEYKNHLKETNTALTELQAGLIAEDYARKANAISTIAENWDDWSDSIDKGQEALKNGESGSLDYYEAMGKLKKETGEMLGTQGELSDEFIVSAKESGLLEKAIKGDEKAINELQKKAAKDLVNKKDLEDAKELFKSNTELLDNFDTSYDDLADTIADADLQPGEIATGELADQLTTMYNQAYLAALAGGASVEGAMAAANAAINSEGFDVPEMEMETVEVTGTLPDGWTPQPDGTVMTTDANGVVTPVQGVKILSNEGETYTYTMTMPKTKKGGGFRKNNEKIDEADTGSKGGKGGGGGGSKKEKWENPYDEFYNTVEDINEELRTREKLERRYQALLDKTGTKASDLVKNAQDQIKSLEKQKKLREGLLQGRNRQMSDIEAEYSDLSKYAWYNEEDATIEIDWDKIEALDGSTNEELTSRIEEYISKLEEQQELIESEEDELAAIEEILREIRDQGKDEYFDLEAQIKEALIDSRQQEIDKLSEINESINDTNSRLIDAMQSSIDQYRQDRENEKTEEELADKQRRLAYLQQDTSGANALDIMQLQEEIDQAQEDYTDTLIDQKISELQQQNDEAAEQREKQIDLMQAQLDKWTESGEIWAEVYRLMDTGMDNDGIKAGSELEKLLMEGASFKAMSNLEKMKWLEELENNVAMAIQWLMVGNSTKGLLSTGQVKKDQSITFTTKDGKTVTGTVQKDGTVKTSTGEVYKDVYRSYDGKTFYTNEDYIEPTQQEPEPEKPTAPEPEQKTIKVGGKINAKGAKIYGWPGGTGYTQYFKDDPIYKVLDIQGQYLKVRWHKRTSGTTGWFKKNDVKAYKQGGLADFTGPAWLDGTKSKPEYILNADQTKAFFELVDVLGGLRGIGQSSQITGDSIYDVDINVESIGSDYDVEQLASTIKRMINDDARYRNNNAINLSR